MYQDAPAIGNELPGAELSKFQDALAGAHRKLYGMVDRLVQPKVLQVEPDQWTDLARRGKNAAALITECVSIYLAYTLPPPVWTELRCIRNLCPTCNPAAVVWKRSGRRVGG
jgi:hypothetical protein